MVERGVPGKGRPLPKRRRTTATMSAAEEELNKEQSAQNFESLGVKSTPIGNGNGNAKGKGESKGDITPLSMILADPDLLDCAICFEPLCSPVYQCENGHIACASCCTTILKNKCSNCCLPIENIRCRAIKRVVESLRVACQYKTYGCMEMLSYSKKLAHEKACKFIPCSCPYIGCDFVGMSKHLYDHFGLQHKDSSKKFLFNLKISISMDSAEKYVILREEREGVLFVLYRCTVTLGSVVNVVCVAPPASEKRFYELIANIGEDSTKIITSVEMRSKWIAQTPAKMCLLVPRNLTSQLLSLDLIIRKKPSR